MTHLYKNRDGNIFEFHEQKDGTILWKGDFKYYSISYVEDIDEIYSIFLKNKKKSLLTEKKPSLTKEEFRKHMNFGYSSEIFKEFVVYRGANHVDPSGGPLIGIGMDMGLITNKMIGKIVKNIKHHKGHFLLIF